MMMNEVSIEELINILSNLEDRAHNKNVQFFSPSNKRLELDQIYHEHPDTYVLIEFDEIEDVASEKTITVSDFINKLKSLGDEYLKGFVDFLDPENKSMILRFSDEEDSFIINEEGGILIQFYEWIPDKYHK